MLEVDGIQVQYGRIAAVRGASFRVDKGEIVVLVGPNGAGKSTTMMAIAGALTPSQGTIRLDGQSIVGRSPETIARLGLFPGPVGE